VTPRPSLQPPSGGARLLPLFLAALFLAAMAGALMNITGPHAYLPRLLFLGSLFALILFVVRGRREIVFVFLKARRVSEPGPAVTWILLGAVLLASSLLLSRVPVRIDATSRKLNRLSEASRAILASVDRPIEMIGVYRETSPQRDRAIDVLEVYKNESRKIKTRLLDPDRRPDEARELGLTRSGIVLIRSGNVREEAEDLSEESLTQAILRTQYPGRTRIGFTTGHEERVIGNTSPGGLGKFAGALRQSGYDPSSLSILEADVPADVAALAIVGPRRAFFPGEITRIEKYLDGGGRLLICLDPGADAGLGEFLRRQGVVLDSLEVMDEGAGTQSLGMGPRTIVVQDYARHPIIPGVLGRTVFSGARAVIPTKEPIWGVDEKVLLWTGRQARLAPYVRTAGSPAAAEGVPGKSQAIPIGLAEEWETTGSGVPAPGQAAAEKPYARLVLMGDSDWLLGQFFDLYSNHEFAMRTIGWLAHREFLLKIPPMETAGTPLKIGLGGLKTLFYVLQVGIPLGLLGVGLWIWTRRR
jgi:hypothetical protein